jgi:hypothetical protein
MPRILTSFLTFHWAAAFALLSIACVMGGDGGAAQAMSMLGLAANDLFGPAGVFASALLSLVSAVCSVLFFWAFATSVFSDPEVDGDGDVLRIAFASAASLISLLTICGAANVAAGVYQTAAVHLAALLASYLAIQAERIAAIMSASPNEGDIRAAARLMALGAAHSTMLSRLSGRAGANFAGGR